MGRAETRSRERDARTSNGPTHALSLRPLLAAGPASSSPWFLSGFAARSAAACFVVLELLLAAGAAGAQTSRKLVSNTGQTDAGTATLANDHAQAFTTGSHTRGYKLTRVDLEIAKPAMSRPTA